MEPLVLLIARESERKLYTGQISLWLSSTIQCGIVELIAYFDSVMYKL